MTGFLGTMERSTVTGNNEFVRGRLLDVVSWSQQDKVMRDDTGNKVNSNLFITLFKRLIKGQVMILTDKTIGIENQWFRVVNVIATMTNSHHYDLLEIKKNGP